MDAMDMISIGLLSGSAKTKTTNHGIEVVSCTLLDLLRSHTNTISGSDISGVITIPEYQRAYVWKEKQINKLLLDLVEYKQKEFDNKPLYYLGSIIIHSEGKKLNIIDGQQRLTTMLILNSLIHKHPLTNVKYTSPVSIENIQYSHRYLKAIFNKEVSNLQHLSVDEIVDFSLINVTLVVTKNEDLAYTFFETQNTGGIRLSGTDIAKAHHLRAIKSKKEIAYQAKDWERFDVTEIGNCINNLIKIRYWNKLNWNIFPFYKNEPEIKETVIEEFTENTLHDSQDINYYYFSVKTEKGKSNQIAESEFPHIRQPLYDGNNFLSYIKEYVNLRQVLFKQSTDHRISDLFYEFRDELLHGKNGTIFLKELMEIALITYVSRFGFDMLLNFSLWMYRYIYSMRVGFDRNIKESSIFKFVSDQSLLDIILESYTISGLLAHLMRFSYNFSADYTKEGQSKDKHVSSIKDYFARHDINLFTNAEDMAIDNLFDKKLITGIQCLLKQTKQND